MNAPDLTVDLARFQFIAAWGPVPRGAEDPVWMLGGSGGVNGMPVAEWHYKVYGMVLRSDLSIPELQPCSPGAADIAVCWTEPVQEWEGPWFREWDHEGAAWLRFARVAEGYLLQFKKLARFLVTADGGGVSCQGVEGVSEHTVRHLLLDQVLPLVLSRKGVLVFHGSGVDLGSGAVAFLGKTGRGKSTLAGYFARRGHPLMSDDCVALTREGDGFTVAPAYPGVRLWGDSLRFLDGSEEACPAVMDGKTKRRYACGDVMEFAGRPAPLRQLYFLSGAVSDELEITKLAGAELMSEVIQAQFMLDSEDERELEWSFRAANEIARRGNCYRLSVPRDFGRLAECAAEIVRHSAGTMPRENTDMEFDTSKRWVARKRLSSSEIDGEAVVLNLADGNYYGLNDLAARVWRELQEPRTVDGVAAMLAEEYEVTAEVARVDVVKLMTDMEQRKLIEAVA